MYMYIIYWVIWKNFKPGLEVKELSAAHKAEAPTF